MNFLLFRDAATMLFGQNYVPPIAMRLRVAERTVHRWNAGEASIPDGIAEDLAALCEERAEELRAMAGRLRDGHITAIDARLTTTKRTVR